MAKETKYYHKNSNVVAFCRSEYTSHWDEKTYDERGNQLTYKDSEDTNWERTYDKFGNELTYSECSGYSYEYTYDELGNRLTFKNSNGNYFVRTTEVTKEEFEAFIDKQTRPCVGKKVMVDGVEYELK